MMIDALMNRLFRKMAITRRLGCYELRGDMLIKNPGSRHEETLELANIRRWYVLEEMTFDDVVMEMGDGAVVVWRDTYDDLIGLLRGLAGTKVPAEDRPMPDTVHRQR